MIVTNYLQMHFPCSGLLISARWASLCEDKVVLPRRLRAALRHSGKGRLTNPRATVGRPHPAPGLGRRELCCSVKRSSTERSVGSGLRVCSSGRCWHGGAWASPPPRGPHRRCLPLPEPAPPGAALALAPGPVSAFCWCRTGCRALRSLRAGGDWPPAKYGAVIPYPPRSTL